MRGGEISSQKNACQLSRRARSSLSWLAGRQTRQHVKSTQPLDKWAEQFRVGGHQKIFSYFEEEWVQESSLLLLPTLLASVKCTAYKGEGRKVFNNES